MLNSLNKIFCESLVKKDLLMKLVATGGTKTLPGEIKEIERWEGSAVPVLEEKQKGN